MEDEKFENITITGSSGSVGDTIVINLNDTYGATTSYDLGQITDIGTITIGPNMSGSYTIPASDTIDLSNIVFTNGSSTQFDGWIASPNTHIEISEVEKMCIEYPALAKVYENFKTVYDLVKQDWEGKKNADKDS